MAATVRGYWKQQDRMRITVLEMEKLEQEGRAVVCQEEIIAMIARVESWSPLLRSRMLANWDLFPGESAASTQAHP
jgi:hypothetical protein